MAHLNTLRRNPNLAENQNIVSSQWESSTKNTKTSSANQSRVSRCRKTPKRSRLGLGTLLGSRLVSPPLGSLQPISIHGGSPTPSPSWSAHTLTTVSPEPLLKNCTINCLTFEENTRQPYNHKLCLFLVLVSNWTETNDWKKKHLKFSFHS